MGARGFVVAGAVAGAPGQPAPAPEATWSDVPGPGLEPEDADFGAGALIALVGIILLAAVVASIRALRKRSAR